MLAWFESKVLAFYVNEPSPTVHARVGQFGQALAKGAHPANSLRQSNWPQERKKPKAGWGFYVDREGQRRGTDITLQRVNLVNR
jgi:hypothetical protein